MKDQAALAPNGELIVAIPLYRYQHEESLGNLDGYSLALTNGKPIAYILDCGPIGNQMFNAEFVEKNVEFLGDL